MGMTSRRLVMAKYASFIEVVSYVFAHSLPILAQVGAASVPCCTRNQVHSKGLYHSSNVNKSRVDVAFFCVVLFRLAKKRHVVWHVVGSDRVREHRNKVILGKHEAQRWLGRFQRRCVCFEHFESVVVHIDVATLTVGYGLDRVTTRCFLLTG